MVLRGSCVLLRSRVVNSMLYSRGLPFIRTQVTPADAERMLWRLQRHFARGAAAGPDGWAQGRTGRRKRGLGYGLGI